MSKCKILFTILLVFIIVPWTTRTVDAQHKNKLHPMNKKLIEQGMMGYPKYLPQIPRISAQTAYGLYLQNKALFVYISYKDTNLIVGGMHFKEGAVKKINPNKLPFRPGQVLVVYCP